MLDNTNHPAFGPRLVSPLSEQLGLGDILQDIANGAAKRDTTRELPHTEIAELKEAGFGALRLKDGTALSLTDLFTVGRDLAAADSNIAHAFRNHLWNIEAALRQPDHPLHARVLKLAAVNKTIGLGFVESDVSRAGALPDGVQTRLAWDQAAGHYIGNGKKVYATGNIFNDAWLGTATESRGNRVVTYLFEDQSGVSRADDWQGFGQRLTGSGTMHFDAITIKPTDIYPPEDTPLADGAPWRYTFHQVWLTNCIAGIARRILLDAQNVLRSRGRNFYHGATDHPSQEPVLLAHLGRIRALASAIEAVADRMVAALDRADHLFGTSDHFDAALAATLAASEAKVFIDEQAPILAGWLIDLGSGSVVSTQGALDRHWRNIKVIASHNPRLYKEEFLGRNLLDSTLPPTGAFF